MRVLGIIPVRFHSTRFPGKALVDIQGKTMIQRVYEQAQQAKGLLKVLIATDHEEIFRHVKGFGGNVHMTATSHPSGTDRCKEAMKLEEDHYDFVINIQGDEPFIDPNQIDELSAILSPQIEIATQAKVISQQENLTSSNCVKVVFNQQGNAIYFSRSPIPYLRNNPDHHWVNSFIFYQHIGIYAYRTDVLKKITKLPVSLLEKAESLEQLRWLENGYNIHVMVTKHQAHGIDTPEDLIKILANNNP